MHKTLSRTSSEAMQHLRDQSCSHQRADGRRELQAAQAEAGPVGLSHGHRKLWAGAQGLAVVDTRSLGM